MARQDRRTHRDGRAGGRILPERLKVTDQYCSNFIAEQGEVEEADPHDNALTDISDEDRRRIDHVSVEQSYNNRAGWAQHDPSRNLMQPIKHVS